MNKQEMLKLLNKYEQAYYSGESIISDEEYDALKDKYIEQYGEYTFVPSEGSTGFAKVKHEYPLLSLSKVQLSDKEKLRKELERLWPVVIQPKFDGLSVGVQAENVATRGNGEIGDDVTKQCLQIEGMDSVMELVQNEETGPLRAEIMMLHSSFIELNKEREAQGLKLFDNCRNAAAGMLRNKDVSKVKGLTAMIYEELGSTANESDDMYNIKELIGEDELEYLEDSIRITPLYKPVDIEAAIDFLEHLEDYRKTIDYDIDGWVVKADIDNSLAHHGGMTGHHPKNAFAVKGEAKGAWTRLIGVTWQTGKHYITPVAELEPVRIEGSTISRATLHNVSIMEALGLTSIVDSGGKTLVKVIKANDVIPKIIEIKEELEDGYVDIDIEIPSSCPVCEGETAIKETDSDSKMLMCLNPECSAKLHARIEQMASRDGFNIVGLSEGTITKILDTFYINSPEEILDFTEDELIQLEGFAKKSANNLDIALRKARTSQPMNKVMYSAAIPLVGRDASNRICKHYSIKEISAILSKDDEEAIKDFCVIKGIGKEIAASLVKHKEILRHMFMAIDEVINVSVKEDDTKKEQYSFCITGQREPFKTMITEAGHKVTGSVSKKTRALIDSTMDMSTTKALKAIELNIPIIDTVEKLKNLL